MINFENPILKLEFSDLYLKKKMWSQEKNASPTVQYFSYDFS